VEKDVTGVIYDKWSALHWCLNNLTVAVGLDVDEFEFQAKRGKLPPNIVTIQTNKELRAQIAQDLSDLLLPF
jgi:hypothetical protein